VAIRTKEHIKNGLRDSDRSKLSHGTGIYTTVRDPVFTKLCTIMAVFASIAIALTRSWCVLWFWLQRCIYPAVQFDFLPSRVYYFPISCPL